MNEPGDLPRGIPESAPLVDNNPLLKLTTHSSPGAFIDVGRTILTDNAATTHNVSDKLEGLGLLVKSVRKTTPQTASVIEGLVSTTEKVASSYPGSSSQFSLAEVYLDANEIDKAIGLLAHIPSSEAEQAYALRNKIFSTYLAEGDDEAATNFIISQNIQTDTPRTAHRLTALADVQFTNGKTEAAQETLGKAMEVANRRMSNVDEDQFVDNSIIQTLSLMAEDHPQSQAVQHAIAERLTTIIAKADQYGQGDDPDLLIECASAFANLGSPEKALEVAERLPDDDKRIVYNDIVEAYKRSGNISAAIETLRNIPGEHTSMNNRDLAELLAMNGQLEEAEALIQDAPPVVRAKVYALSGNTEQALENLQATNRPTDTACIEVLSLLYEKAAAKFQTS